MPLPMAYQDTHARTCCSEIRERCCKRRLCIREIKDDGWLRKGSWSWQLCPNDVEQEQGTTEELKSFRVLVPYAHSPLQDRTRTVLTMDDLSAALHEYGVDASR